MNPTQFTNDAGYRTGKASYSGAGTATIQIEDLNANSNYYIYFVLKGSYALPSSVLCYKFSTTDVEAPLLDAMANNSNDAYYTVKSSTTGTISANTYWFLYGEGDGGYPPILNTQITSTSKTYLEAMKDKSIDSLDSEDKITLWETLLGQGSGFDLAQSGSELVENVTNSPGQIISNFIDPSKLLPNNSYVLVVAARNTQGGDPVFRAVGNIRLVDTSGPKISNISTTGRTTTAGAFTGQVTIQFDKDLYLKYIQSNTQTPYKAWTTDAVTGAGTATVQKYVSRMLYINVSQFPEGGTLSIIPHNTESDEQDMVYPYFVTEQGYGSELAPISLRLEKETTEDGKDLWKFVISAPGKDYDGMTSEIITQ